MKIPLARATVLAWVLAAAPVLADEGLWTTSSSGSSASDRPSLESK